MDEKLKKFLIKDFEKMDGSKRKNFLRMLKNNPQSVTQIIKAHLTDWATIAALELGETIVIFDVNSESAELTRHLQEHFIK